MTNITAQIKNPTTIKQIEERSSDKYGSTNNGLINTILDRYFDIIKVGTRELREFTDAEKNLLCDICNGTIFDPFGLILENNAILLQFEDTLDLYGNQFNEKWDTDGDELKTKLENLSKTGQIALIDFIEKFWNTEEG
ncbi:MAG: hypothetical protein ACR2MD_02770 [Aridibacter sp.]